MTRQSITLTPPNDSWLIAQVEERKEYGSKSDVVNDLIRQARARQERIEWIRAQLIEAEQSGPAVDFDRERLLTKFKAELGL